MSSRNRSGKNRSRSHSRQGKRRYGAASAPQAQQAPSEAKTAERKAAEEEARTRFLEHKVMAEYYRKNPPQTRDERVKYMKNYLKVGGSLNSTDYGHILSGDYPLPPFPSLVPFRPLPESMLEAFMDFLSQHKALVAGIAIAKILLVASLLGLRKYHSIIQSRVIANNDSVRQKSHSGVRQKSHSKKRGSKRRHM
jgi:hypothetical protein